ncbi:MAG: hypothetical protein HQ556_01415 [Candidatus Marinimicrobia bacterium]|nr:hypothetical protein [Candidatus Neomarinimicrobiota bacterium]
MKVSKFQDIKLVAQSDGIEDEKIHRFLWESVINDRWGGSFRKMSKLLKLALRVSARTNEKITIPFLKDIGHNMIYVD